WTQTTPLRDRGPRVRSTMSRLLVVAMTGPSVSTICGTHTHEVLPARGPITHICTHSQLANNRLPLLTSLANGTPRLALLAPNCSALASAALEVIESKSLALDILLARLSTRDVPRNWRRIAQTVAATSAPKIISPTINSSTWTLPTSAAPRTCAQRISIGFWLWACS